MPKPFLYRGILVAIGVLCVFFLFFVLRTKATILIKNVSETILHTGTSTPTFQYIEIVDSCAVDYIGECVNVRSEPNVTSKVVARLRSGVVLKVEEVVTVGGLKWYKIKFGTDVHYPERITTDWYVAAGEYVKLFNDVGVIEAKPGVKYTGTKRIVVDVSEQALYAYDGDTIYMESSISTGLELTPTPAGTFSVFRKTPSRYMQGPIPGVSDQIYDLPGVPWDLYFTVDGAVIHGAYWHDRFGQPWSHGCVNLAPERAKKLYLWADIGMPVIVKR